MCYNLNMSANITFTSLIVEVILCSQNHVMYKCVYTHTHTHMHTFLIYVYIDMGLLGGTSGRESTCQCSRQKRREFDP